MNGGRQAIVVFLGPSLPRAEAAALLPPQAVLLPPARQGDVYRAARGLRPGDAIGLVDGAFLEAPAVWHREILWALDRGLRVLGAASMGALRAAELAEFGMRPVGKIAEAYREGHYPPFDDPFEEDDEVAVVHAPPEAGGAPLSDALVDLRETLAAAEAAGVIGRPARDALLAAMRRLHFPRRGFARLAEAARGTPGAAALAGWLAAPGNRVSQKWRDAAALLRALGGEGAADAPPPPVFRMEHALVWERFVAAEGSAAAAAPEGKEEAMVLDELGLDPAAWGAAARAAAGRLALLERDGAAPPDDAADPPAAALDGFRRARGLTTRAALEDWLAANGETAPGLARLLREEAALDRAAQTLPRTRLRRAVLDGLRLSGRYAPLLDRARAKAAARHGGGDGDPGDTAGGIALAWYFETCLGREVPRRPGALAAHARAAGYADEAAFRRAVRAEYRHRGGAG